MKQRPDPPLEVDKIIEDELMKEGVTKHVVGSGNTRGALNRTIGEVVDDETFNIAQLNEQRLLLDSNSIGEPSQLSPQQAEWFRTTALLLLGAALGVVLFITFWPYE